MDNYLKNGKHTLVIAPGKAIDLSNFKTPSSMGMSPAKAILEFFGNQDEASFDVENLVSTAKQVKEGMSNESSDNHHSMGNSGTDNGMADDLAEDLNEACCHIMEGLAKLFEVKKEMDYQPANPMGLAIARKMSKDKSKQQKQSDEDANQQAEYEDS